MKQQQEALAKLIALAEAGDGNAALAGLVEFAKLFGKKIGNGHMYVLRYGLFNRYGEPESELNIRCYDPLAVRVEAGAQIGVVSVSDVQASDLVLGVTTAGWSVSQVLRRPHKDANKTVYGAAWQADEYGVWDFADTDKDRRALTGILDDLREKYEAGCRMRWDCTKEEMGDLPALVGEFALDPPDAGMSLLCLWMNFYVLPRKGTNTRQWETERNGVFVRLKETVTPEGRVDMVVVMKDGGREETFTLDTASIEWDFGRPEQGFGLSPRAEWFGDVCRKFMK